MFHNFLYNRQSSINIVGGGITIGGIRRPFYSTGQRVLSWYLDPTINKNASNITQQLMAAFNSDPTQIGLG